MNLVSSLLFAASLSVASAFRDVRENFGEDRVVDIHLDHFNKVGSLFQDHEADIFGINEEGFASVKLSTDAVSSLEQAGVSFTDSTEDWVEHLQRNLESICLATDGSCSQGDSFYDNYQLYDSIMNRVDSTVKSVSFARSLVLGQSFEGRDIIGVEVGSDYSKPLVYMMCTIHAREWLTPMFCTHFIELLTANGGHPILDTYQFAIVPVGNPDGYIHSTTVSSMWRKTRNTNPGSSCLGTDPNRNWGNNHCRKGTSNNPCSDIYCGPRPFSTPEVNSVNEYAKRHQNRIISWIDVHSYGGMWLSPLGYDYGEPPAVDYNRMATCMKAATQAAQASSGYRFIYGPAADVLGPAAGASDDWFYFAYDVIYSFTLELRGRGFQPGASNIRPSNAEITAGVFAQLDCINQIELLGRDIDIPETNPEETSETPSSSIRGGRIAGAFFSFVFIGIGVLGLAHYFGGSQKKAEEGVVPAEERVSVAEVPGKAKPSEYASTANPMHVEE